MSKPIPLHAKVRDTATVKAVSGRSNTEHLAKANLNCMISEEIARQLKQSGIAPPVAIFNHPRVREAREYAHKVFGNNAKGDRWLLRPSSKFDGVRPIDYLETHDDTNAVYAALDAIAYGFPL